MRDSIIDCTNLLVKARKAHWLGKPGLSVAHVCLLFQCWERAGGVGFLYIFWYKI